MTATPLWTEQVVRPVGGQDHLGVGSVVTDRILPTLSPGINVLTQHPRYWSFYAFVVDEYWRSQPAKMSRKALMEYMSRKEMIFSAAGHMCGNPDHRDSQFPIGSRRMYPLVQESPSSYRVDFPYMKTVGGGYALYYATVMQTTGVVQTADPALGLPADAITPDHGRALADAFRDAIAGTRYWTRYWNAVEVPADVVEEFGNVACLCRLRDDPPDRAPIVDVFLHGGQPGLAEARRASLQMMLEIAHQTRRTGIRQEDFRCLLLYGASVDEESGATTASFTAPAAMGSVARRWRLSQLREMFNCSLNAMWALVTEWGVAHGGDYSPILLSRLSEVAAGVSFRDVPGVSAFRGTPLSTFVETVRVAAGVTDSLDGPWDASAPLTEWGLYTLDRTTSLDVESRLGVLFTMYVLCLARLWDPDLQGTVPAGDWAPVVEGGSLRVGLSFALRQLRHDAHTGSTVGDALLRVLSAHVIAQHERVAVSKLPEDTFRFRRELDRMRFFPQATSFSLNSARFDALASTCAELNWSGFLTEPNHALTAEGTQLRRDGDLPTREFTP